MKDKEVKKMLSDGAKQVLPGGNVKQNIAYRLSLGEEEKVAVLAVGGTKKHFGKTSAVIAVVFAAIAAILCAVLIPYFLSEDNPNSIVPTPIDKFTSIDDADDFYAYGAASVGVLLSSYTNGGTSAVKAAKRLTVSSDTDGIIEILDEYMPLVEGLLGDSTITSQTSSGDSDEKYSSYQYSLVIGYPHLDGEYSTYILYYNRVLSSITIDDGETEEKYDIEGVLSVNGVDYYVTGEHEYETEEGETEEKFTFTAYEDGQPFIRLEQETEQEDGESEMAYLYTFYTDGKATKSVEVEYEQEDGETELQLIVKEGTSKSSFKFALSGSGEMKVSAQVNGKKYTIIVTIADGAYNYVFK